MLLYFSMNWAAASSFAMLAAGLAFSIIFIAAAGFWAGGRPHRDNALTAKLVTGLVLGTFFTLFVIPAVLSVFAGRQRPEAAASESGDHITGGTAPARAAE